MPWIAATKTAGSSGFGATGKRFWFRPDAFTNDDPPFHELHFPPHINSVDEKPSYAQYGDYLLEVGGATENMVVTPDLQFWKQGIRPPDIEPTVVASAGPGITADLVCYTRFSDQETGEISPLSAGVSLSVANQKVTWSNFPVSQNTRVTHIEFWRSVDGGLPRFVMRRQVGVTGTVIEAVDLGGLGEAETEDFDLFPRCQFNVIFHERQFMSGDAENPRTIYCSLVGFPERMSTLTLNTKSQQPVTGLFVVNDQLVVGCPSASERIQGYTEDDISIDIAQPEIGLLTHFGVQIIHGWAWVPTQLGIYVTDASSWYYVSEDIKTKWVAEYKANQTAYETGWSIHDTVTNVYMFYVGTHSDTDNQATFWTADYKTVIPLEGGNMGQPAWSYDVSQRGYSSAAILALPGAKRGDVYFGGNQDGTIYVQEELDTTDAGDVNEKRFYVRFPTDHLGDAGGDLAHGKRVTEATIFIRSELNEWEFNLYGGDSDPWPMLHPSFESDIISASAASIGFGTAQPRWSHFRPIPKAVGQAFVVEVIAYAPSGVQLAGYQLAWKEGPMDRFAATGKA